MAVRLGAVLVLLVLSSSAVLGKTLLDLVKERPNLSKVASIVEGDQLTKLQFEQVALTAFLPTDEALGNYTGPHNRQLIQAHMSNTPLLVEDLGPTVATMYKGNPDLYVTKLPSGQQAITGWEDNHYFINNAKVLVANQKATTSEGVEQVLHVIDEVLPPTHPQGRAEVPVKGYPTAADLLLNWRAYGLTGDLSVEMFQKRVLELQLEEVFRSPGKNTFFIPLDRGIKDTSSVLDVQVVHGHVVPGRALFTRPASLQEEEVESLAFTDNLKVLLRVERVTPRPPPVYYVTSNTVASDQRHQLGTAMAQVARANILVANGVVHLIARRLMTNAESIMSYLKEEGGQLSEFYRLFHEHQQDLLNRLSGAPTPQGWTLFAPNNHAFNMVKADSLETISLNKAKLGELLKLHMVSGRLTTDKIEQQATLKKLEVPTESRDRKLYFNVYREAGGAGGAKLPVVTVEGAGVNATIRTPNIVTNNGIIHIIDRIMDIPSQTVYEKLMSNPEISVTYNLSSQGTWGAQFRDRAQKFTFFVPNDDAWDDVRTKMPSAYKKLVMGEFPQHVRTILQRHLLVGKDLPLTALLALTNNGTLNPASPHTPHLLNMSRGKIMFEMRVQQNANEYYVEWNGLRARVVQADVECVNGVVHIVDKVLMTRQDVTVSGATTPFSFAFFSTAAILITSAILR